MRFTIDLTSRAMSETLDSQTEGSQEEALDRFSQRSDPVMMVLALVWLPVLVIPLVTTLHGSVALTFDIVDYVIWVAFGVEYAVKIWLANDKKRFFTHHLVDLAVVAVPVLRPLRFAAVPALRETRQSRSGAG